MKRSRGRITAQLDDHDKSPLSDLIPLINQRINPPTPLTDSDLFIRAMYIVSDETNSYGGRFPSDEHPHLAELLINSPVLVGHRRDLLPIGRTFHAACLEQDGRRWIKSYFYWLKSAEGAETLRDNIDGGIYKECSIGFIYGLPECSICGKDIRLCQHEPLQEYAVNGEAHPCHFNYRQIERVLETSLVYRGAIPDTSITRDLAITKSTGLPEPVMLASLSDLPPADRYLVTPRYEGIDLRLTQTEHGWRTSRLNGESIALALDGISHHLPNPSNRFARLVGFRGKERCSLQQLERYLSDSSGPVSRVMAFLYPVSEEDLPSLQSGVDSATCRMIRSRFVDRANLESAIQSVATRDGVEIRLVGIDQSDDYFVLRPENSNRSGPAATLSRMAHSEDWLLDIKTGGPRQFLVRQFDPSRFRRGSRFVADAILPPIRIPTDDRQTMAWQSATVKQMENALSLEVGEKNGGELRIQPITLDGKARYLFYRADITASR
jgi:hypothetical protein